MPGLPGAGEDQRRGQETSSRDTLGSWSGMGKVVLAGFADISRNS